MNAPLISLENIPKFLVTVGAVLIFISAYWFYQARMDGLNNQNNFYELSRQYVKDTAGFRHLNDRCNEEELNILTLRGLDPTRLKYYGNIATTAKYTQLPEIFAYIQTQPENLMLLKLDSVIRFMEQASQVLKDSIETISQRNDQYNISIDKLNNNTERIGQDILYSTLVFFVGLSTLIIGCIYWRIREKKQAMLFNLELKLKRAELKLKKQEFRARSKSHSHEPY